MKNILTLKPSFEKTILANGLTVITEKVSNYQSFSLGIFINAGSRDDINNKNGTAHFLEHYIFRKSKKFNSKQIANKFEEFGAYTNAYTTQELTCFYVRALNPHLIKSINLLLEIVFNPDFDIVEAEKEKQIIIEEIKSYEDDLEEHISDLGDKLIFDEHTLGNPILGTNESLNNNNIDSLNDFHQKYYNTENMSICLIGNFEHNRVIEYISKFLNVQVLNKKYKNQRIIPEFKLPSQQILFKPIQQTHLLFLNHIDSVSINYKYVIGIFNLIFGDGMSSRLYQNIRDKYGLAYSIYSNVSFYSDCNIFSIYAAIDPENLNFFGQLVYKEIQKLDKITDKEFKRAKEQFKSAVIMDSESLSTRMQSIAKNDFMGQKYEKLENIIDIINDIQKEDINILVNNYFLNKKFFELFIKPEINPLVRKKHEKIK